MKKHHTTQAVLSSIITLTLIGLTGCATPFDKDAGVSASANTVAIGERYQSPKQKPAQIYQVDLDEISQINIKLASAYYSAGQFQTAQDVISLALAATPNNHQALGLAALIQERLNNRTKALEYFNQAFKIAPGDADLNHNFGIYLCNNNDPARAIDHFKAALQVEGYQTPANSLSAAADCLVKMGRDEEAIQYYTGALRLAPSNASALIGMADLQYHRGAWQQSHEYMKRYARVSSANPNSLWLQIRLARKLGLSQDEKDYSADLRRSFPNAPVTTLLNEGRFE